MYYIILLVKYKQESTGMFEKRVNNVILLNEIGVERVKNNWFVLH